MPDAKDEFREIAESKLPRDGFHQAGEPPTVGKSTVMQAMKDMTNSLAAVTAERDTLKNRLDVISAAVEKAVRECQTCGGSGSVNGYIPSGRERGSNDFENWPEPCPACLGLREAMAK